MLLLAVRAKSPKAGNLLLNLYPLLFATINS